MTKEELYKKVLEKYGYHGQLLKLSEEMGECSAALARMVNDDHGNKVLVESFIEECADVRIVLEQIAMELGPKFEMMKNQKLARLGNKMDLGEEFRPQAWIEGRL